MKQPKLTCDQINAELDKITQTVRKRMDFASNTMLGLLPTEYDWMTPAEKTRTHELKLQLPSYGQLALEARKRLAIRRANRKNHLTPPT